MMNQHPRNIRDMHGSRNKHGNMTFYRGEQFAAFSTIKCMTSGCFFSHFETSARVKLDYFPIFPQGWNNRRQKDRQVQITWNKNPSDNSQLQIDFEDGCIGRVNQTLFFFSFVFPKTFFGLVDRRFFVGTFRENTSSVVMEEYSKWATDSKQNLDTFNRS